MDTGALAMVAALVGALSAFGVWTLMSRRHIGARAAELQRIVDATTTELESSRLQLQRLSTDDPLTSAANHEQFLAFLEREWRRSRREGVPVSLIFVDIDHFRAYNRQFGREAGDDVLKQVSRSLAAVVGRPGDLVARYHRDEFAVVLGATDGPGALKIAEQIRQSIAELKMASSAEASEPIVTVSVATSSAVPQRESAWEELDLIKAARQGLRQATAGGGNRVVRAGLGVAGPPELTDLP